MSRQSQIPCQQLALTQEERARLVSCGFIAFRTAPPAPAKDPRGHWITSPEEHAATKARNECVARAWVAAGRPWGSLAGLCAEANVATSNVVRAAKRLGLT